MVLQYDYASYGKDKGLQGMTTQKNAVNSGDAKTSAKKGLKFTREQLIDLHWTQGLSMTDIGRQFGVTPQAVKYWLNHFGIEHRARLQDVLFEASPTLSYVFGVLHGDGCLYVHPTTKHHYILLAVIDKPFAESFQRALQILGIRAGLIPLKARGNSAPQWKTYASSRKFHELWNSMNSLDRLSFGMKYPSDFIRGVYESEGSVKLHRGSLEACIYSTNIIMQEMIMDALKTHGFAPRWFERNLESGKRFVVVQLHRSLEIKRFIAWIVPCIKFQPRQSNANPEPSQDGDILEGVESTKDDQPGSQVGNYPVMD